MGKYRGDLGFVRRGALVALMVVFGWSPGLLHGLALGALTTARDVRALTPDQARQARPVRLRGVVTDLSGWKNSFFIQDATAGISVDRTDHAEVHVGDLVELSGVSNPGMFAPLVLASIVRVIGHVLPPQPRRVRYIDMVGGAEDSQWIEVQGIIHSARISELFGHAILTLTLETDGASIRVLDQDFAGIDYNHLIDSTVRVRGVCSTTFNQKRQFVGLGMFVPDRRDIEVVHPAPEDPFGVAAISVRNVLQFGQGSHRVKVTGISTYQIPGHALYLQDGSDGILVQNSSSELVEPGKEVEAVGFPATGEYAPILKDGFFRVVGNAAPITPLRIEAKDAIAQQVGFDRVPYDGQLVSLQGRVLESHIQVSQRVWILKQDEEVFDAYLPLSATVGVADHIAVGSMVLLTGICTVHANSDRQPISFSILLRSSQDIVVLTRATWWNANHAWWVVGLLTLVILGMLGWMAVARRQAQLRSLIVTDPLTGLYNRRGFLLLAQYQWRLALRRKSQIALFYIDVDQFKKINDSLGHKQGDQALRDLATVLRQCFRSTDIVARLGGDEFAAITDDGSQDCVAEIEQRIARTIIQRNSEEARAYKLSLSLGILSCDSSLGAFSIDELLDKADALMYEQKREHKNRST